MHGGLTCCTGKGLPPSPWTVRGRFTMVYRAKPLAGGEVVAVKSYLHTKPGFDATAVLGGFYRGLRGVWAAGGQAGPPT